MKNLKIGTVEVTTFENEHNDRKFNSTKIKNSYFDKKDNEWKPTDSFSDEQLMTLKVLIDNHLESKVKVYNGEPKQDNSDIDDEIDF